MSAALLDHLWQSTLFAICAWSLAWVLRENGAHLRHAVWVVASIKFLIPFSLLTMLGQQLRPHVGMEDAHVLAALVERGEHGRQAQPLEPLGRRLVQREGHDDHAVQPLGERQAGQQR